MRRINARSNIHLWLIHVSSLTWQQSLSCVAACYSARVFQVNIAAACKFSSRWQNTKLYHNARWITLRKPNSIRSQLEISLFSVFLLMPDFVMSLAVFSTSSFCPSPSLPVSISPNTYFCWQSHVNNSTSNTICHRRRWWRQLYITSHFLLAPGLKWHTSDDRRYANRVRYRKNCRCQREKSNNVPSFRNSINLNEIRISTRFYHDFKCYYNAL